MFVSRPIPLPPSVLIDHLAGHFDQAVIPRQQPKRHPDDQTVGRLDAFGVEHNADLVQEAVLQLLGGGLLKWPHVAHPLDFRPVQVAPI